MVDETLDTLIPGWAVGYGTDSGSVLLGEEESMSLDEEIEFWKKNTTHEDKQFALLCIGISIGLVLSKEYVTKAKEELKECHVR